MDDNEAMQLLRLLYKYHEEHAIDPDDSIGDLVEDLAMSMDNTSDEAEKIRREIGF